MGRPRKNPFPTNDLQSYSISDTNNESSQALQSSPPNRPAPSVGAQLNDDSRAQRPKRIPVGAQPRIYAPERPGYVRRYVNDVPGRIERFLRAGYTIVEDENLNTVHRSKDPSVLGAQQRISVGRGTQAVLMEIQKEFYEEDQAAKRKANNEIIKSLRTPKEGQYGAGSAPNSAFMMEERAGE